jgi:Zn-dependent oligopeptidase
LSAEQSRLLDETVNTFRRNGAELDDARKAQLAEIDIELARETNLFAQNVVDSTDAYELFITDREAVAGLPDSELESAAKSASSKGRNGWRFTLQGPSFVGAMTYLENRELRETLYRAYN